MHVLSLFRWMRTRENNVVAKGNTGKGAKKSMTFIASVLNIIFKTKSKTEIGGFQRPMHSPTPRR